MAREYSIKFDVENGGKALNVISVTLTRSIERDVNKTFRIDLCDDPLYPALCEYVKNNPLKEES